MNRITLPKIIQRIYTGADIKCDRIKNLNVQLLTFVTRIRAERIKGKKELILSS